MLKLIAQVFEVQTSWTCPGGREVKALQPYLFWFHVDFFIVKIIYNSYQKYMYLYFLFEKKQTNKNTKIKQSKK
jgi:uncharacterized membrane protein